MRRPLTRTIVLAVVIAIAVVVSACGPKPTSLRGEQAHIGIATWPGFAPAILAKDRGYFGDLQVSVDVVDDFSARQAAFTSGRHDFTIYTIDSLAFDAGHGVDGQVVLVLDESHGADGIVVRRGIARTEDLRGKRVAYTRGSPAHFFLVDLLREAHMTVADIVTVEVDDPTRAAQAFLAGSVDAAVTWEPFLSQIRNAGQGVVLADTSTRPGRIVDVLVASRGVMRDHPNIVRAVVDGWKRASVEVHHPRSDTITLMARGLGMSEADFQNSAAGVSFADEAMNRRWLASQQGHPSAAVQLFESSGQVWRSENLSNSPQSATGYFEPSYALAH